MENNYFNNKKNEKFDFLNDNKILKLNVENLIYPYNFDSVNKYLEIAKNLEPQIDTLKNLSKYAIPSVNSLNHQLEFINKSFFSSPDPLKSINNFIDSSTDYFKTLNSNMIPETPIELFNSYGSSKSDENEIFSEYTSSEFSNTFNIINENKNPYNANSKNNSFKNLSSHNSTNDIGKSNLESFMELFSEQNKQYAAFLSEKTALTEKINESATNLEKELNSIYKKFNEIDSKIIDLTNKVDNPPKKIYKTYIEPILLICLAALAGAFSDNLISFLFNNKNNSKIENEMNNEINADKNNYLDNFSISETPNASETNNKSP